MPTSYFADPPNPNVEKYWERLLDAKHREDATIPTPPNELIAFADIYGPLFHVGAKPLVLAQLGQSLDGFIATEAGASHYITGPESLVHLHRLRAICDAVIVGAGTVLSDDPRLTVRRVAGTSPLRVVLDPMGRVGPDRKVFNDDGITCLHVTRPDANVSSASERLIVPDDKPFAETVLSALSARGCRRILIEGGGITVSRMIMDGLVDRLHLVIAPLILGDGRRGLKLPPYTDLSKAPRPNSQQMQVGRDVLFDLDLRTML
jgi:riboflavin-specific deaminase-like protein